MNKKGLSIAIVGALVLVAIGAGASSLLKTPQPVETQGISSSAVIDAQESIPPETKLDDITKDEILQDIKDSMNNETAEEKQARIDEMAKNLLESGLVDNKEDALKQAEELINFEGEINDKINNSIDKNKPSVPSGGGSSNSSSKPTTPSGGNTNQGGNNSTPPATSNKYPDYVPGKDYSNSGFTYKGRQFDNMKHFSRNHGGMTVEEAENATGGTTGADESGLKVQ